MKLGTASHKPVEHCSDRELLEEIVQRGRTAEAALEALSQNPMVAALMAGKSPMEAMMSR